MTSKNKHDHEYEHYDESEDEGGDNLPVAVNLTKPTKALMFTPLMKWV